MPDLYFYDSTDSNIVNEARSLGNSNPDIIIRGVKSYTDVLTALDVSIRNRQKFANIYFNTHGSPGFVDLPEGSLNLINTFQLKTRKDIFSRHGRVLFMGCNVGEDEVGWKFLDAVGRDLVHNGFVGASTSVVIATRGGLIEPRLPKWGLLRIVQVKNGKAVKHTETGSLVAHALDWLFD